MELNIMSMNCQKIMESNETTEDKETRSDQQDTMKNNWMEQTKIPQVRAIVERQDPSSKEVFSSLLLLFLSFLLASVMFSCYSSLLVCHFCFF